MSVVAVVAFLLNRDNGFTVRRVTQQADLERARYLAEAGLQAVNFAVQAAGCNGVFPTSSSPINNNGFAGGSYSAYSKSPGGSPVDLVATGRYNGAAVTLTRSQVRVYQARNSTTLQPGAGQDAYLNVLFPNRNYGGDVILRLYTGSYQPLLKFDLSSFPIGTRVTPWYDPTTSTLKPGATLSLYQSQIGSTSATAINAQLITRSWIAGTMAGSSATPNGATWNTYDGVNAWPSPGVGYASTPVASTAYKNAIGWVDWDVTNAVAGWLGGVYPNYGLWLVESGGNIGDTYYVSSENSTKSQRPKLTLNYLQPCATALAVVLAPVADAYLKSGTDQSTNFGGATVMDTSSNNPGPEQRMLLRFDMTTIPSGTTLKSATLRLYCSSVASASSSDKTINAFYVLESWTEGTMSGTGTANGTTWMTRDGTTNWSTAGGYYYTSWIVPGKEEATGLSPLPAAFRQGWVTFDITAAAQYWLDNGPTTSNGVLLIYKNSDTDIFVFNSRESTSGNAPQLVVTY